MPKRKLSRSSPEETQAHRGDDDFHYLFANNPQPTWVFDPETLAFLAVNDAALRVYGF